MKFVTIISISLFSLNLLATEYIAMPPAVGSIKHINPALEIISYSANYTTYQEQVKDRDSIKLRVFSDLRRHTDNEILTMCKKHNTNSEKVYYGLDNISFSQRQITTNREYGQEMVVLFNQYCATSKELNSQTTRKSNQSTTLKTIPKNKINIAKTTNNYTYSAPGFYTGLSTYEWCKNKNLQSVKRTNLKEAATKNTENYYDVVSGSKDGNSYIPYIYNQKSKDVSFISSMKLMNKKSIIVCHKS